MSALSILLEDGTLDPPSVLVSCANPIFLCTEPVFSAGVDFLFEVLEADARMLQSRLNKQEQYSLDSGPLFFGELKSLQPCDSTHPALGLLRYKPTLRGVMTVHKIVNVRGGTQFVN